MFSMVAVTALAAAKAAQGGFVAKVTSIDSRTSQSACGILAPLLLPLRDWRQVAVLKRLTVICWSGG